MIKKKYRKVYANFLNLEITVDDLISEGALKIERLGSTFSITDTLDVEPPISFTGNNIEHALEMFLHDKITRQMLQDWANILIMSDSYAIDNTISSSQRQEILSILHEIASPEIFEQLTHENTKFILEKLSIVGSQRTTGSK